MAAQHSALNIVTWKIPLKLENPSHGSINLKLTTYMLNSTSTHVIIPHMKPHGSL
jgi:hypothetical protein